MLVYATTVWLAAELQRVDVLTVIARWLGTKTRTPMTADWLSRSGEPKMRDGSRVAVVSKTDGLPELWAMSYSHPDAEVSGRRWTTEIGLRRQTSGGDIECSVVVQTSEISARVTAPVSPSRPTVVPDLAAAGFLASPTPGRQLWTLTDDVSEAEAFLYGVEDLARKHVYVLISPDSSGKYLVDSHRLQSLLIGLADVVLIAPSADTFVLERALGKQYAVWRGAVNVIFPKTMFSDRAFVETRRLLADDIAELSAKGVQPESEILSIVTHRTNLPISWRSISTQRVHEAVWRHESTLRLQEAKVSGDQTEYIKLLEENDTEQSRAIKDLEGRVEGLEDDLAGQQDLVRRLRYELEHAHDTSDVDVEVGPTTDDRTRDSILAVLNGRATPEDVLAAIALLFPDRLLVLPTAWKSARESDGFKDPRRVLQLLQTLATDYWKGMCSGKGDIEAGRVFGNAYAARESETVEANSQALKRRTFPYKGENVAMLRHLKIGQKDSRAETMRIHFHWDADVGKVIIGHCGKHLDFN